jgi:hypothetical protein
LENIATFNFTGAVSARLFITPNNAAPAYNAERRETPLFIYASTLRSLAFQRKRRPCFNDIFAICTTNAA